MEKFSNDVKRIFNVKTGSIKNSVKILT